MHNVRKPNSTDFDLTKCMLDETQVYEAQVEEHGAVIGVYNTRKDAQAVCDEYTALYNEATRVGLAWINDMPESVAQRNTNNEA